MDQAPFETDVRDVSPYLRTPLRTLDEVLRDRAPDRAPDRGGAGCETSDQPGPQAHPRRRE